MSQKYVFITGYITSVGGGQIYCREKEKYCKKQGYETYIFSIEHGKIYIDDLRKNEKDIIPELAWYPSDLPMNAVRRVLSLMADHINYSSADNITIESHYMKGAVWGELLAAKCHGRHLAFPLNEEFHINRCYLPDFIEYKWKRREIVCISKPVMRRLMPEKKLSEAELFSLTAGVSNSVEDVEVPSHLGQIRSGTIIGIIGRLEKPYMSAAIDEVCTIAKKYSDDAFQILVLGGGTADIVESFKEKVKRYPNIDLIISGYIYPLPRALIRAMAVCIAGSGRAMAACREDVPTISVDVYTNKAMGVLGYDTNYVLPPNPLEKETEISVYLEEILYNSYTARHEYTPLPPVDENALDNTFAQHFEFLASAEPKFEYYQFHLPDKRLKSMVNVLTYRLGGLGALKKIQEIYASAFGKNGGGTNNNLIDTSWNEPDYFCGHRDSRRRSDTGKYTLIINYPNLKLGGIEVNFVKLMRYSLKKGHRVIWITTQGGYDKAAFPDIISNGRLEICFYEKFERLFAIPDIKFHKGEKVVMLTCDVRQYVTVEALRRKACVKEFKHFLVIAHFTGNVYYPDRWFSGTFIHKFVYQYYQRIIKRVIQNDCLRAFSMEHLDAYEKYYHLTIKDKSLKILPDFEEEEPFPVHNTKSRCKERAEKFVITTCARFAFPHKGYLLGLVDCFGSVKAEYPWISMQIVGYGDGEAELRKRIDAQPESVKKDIQLLGMVPNDKLKEYYAKSHLIIGLEGAAVDGVKCGIPTLIVRNYSESCETYGFCEEIGDLALRGEPGHNIIPYIIKGIQMKDETYMNYAVKGYEALQQKMKHNPNYFFQQEKAKSHSTVHFPVEAMLGRILNLTIFLREKREKK